MMLLNGKDGMQIVKEYLEINNEIGRFCEYHGDDCFFLEYPEKENAAKFKEWFMNSPYIKEFEEEVPYSMDRYSGDDIIDLLVGWCYWSQEFWFCDECNTPIEVDEDNHWTGDGWCLCEECTKNKADEYIDEYLVINAENIPVQGRVPLNQILDSDTLEENGFELWKESLENGYYGTNDDPVTIIKKDLEFYPKRDYVCFEKSSNPFATYFSIYTRDNEPIEEPHYTDRIYGGYYTYKEMVEDAKKNYDYGDETNYATYMSDWWKENYKQVD